MNENWLSQIVNFLQEKHCMHLGKFYKCFIKNFSKIQFSFIIIKNGFQKVPIIIQINITYIKEHLTIGRNIKILHAYRTILHFFF